MKRSSRRPEQMAETLRQVITESLAREVRDPRVGFVTVTAVYVTSDLSHARVLVSMPGEEAEKTEALDGLQSAAGCARGPRAHSRPEPFRSFISSWTGAWSTRCGSMSC
jgi:ribosome-binding factor A